MLDFETKRQESFAFLSSQENVLKLTDPAELAGYAEIWQVTTEFEARDLETDLDLLVGIPQTFPLVLPDVFISEGSYKKLNRPIPHLMNGGPLNSSKICLYDTAAISVNAAEHLRIVPELLRRAKSILKNGHERTNQDDFQTEFIDYWNHPYADRGVLQNWLSVIQARQPDSVHVLVLNSAIGGFDRIIFEHEDEIQPIKRLLDTQGISFKQQEVFFLGEMDQLVPPFFSQQGEAMTVVESTGSQARFNRYFRDPDLNVVLFSTHISGRTFIVGWIQERPVLSRNGFRDGSISPFEALSKWQKQAAITRLSVKELTDARQTYRSTGMLEPQSRYKLFFAGLGSVGSQLLDMLLTLPISQVCLVDPDILSLDNLLRHICGLTDVGSHKVVALEKYIKNRRPLTTTMTYDQDLISVLTNNLKLPDGYDYLFIAIADFNAETFLSDLVLAGEITKPCFYLFLEPHCAGGHCIYIHPDDPKDLRSMFDHITFKESVIDYSIRSDFTQQDQGCQTTFTPFAGSDLMLFLSKLFPFVLQTITDNLSVSRRFVWFGNLGYLSSKGIPIKEAFRNKTYGAIEEFGI